MIFRNDNCNKFKYISYEKLNSSVQSDIDQIVFKSTCMLLTRDIAEITSKVLNNTKVLKLNNIKHIPGKSLSK